MNNFAVQQTVKGMRNNFINKGMNTDVALKSAYASLQHMVNKQASVLSYMDVFLYLGVLFLICVPFILLVRGDRAKKIDLSEAVH